MTRSMTSLGAALAVFLTSLGGEARAQMLVHDPAAVGQLIGQAQTALSQLQQLREQLGQAQQLYASLNEASAVNTIARGLLSPELRKVVPEVGELQAAARGDLRALGALADRARAIRETYRASSISGAEPLSAALETSGALAARDLALGEQLTDAAAARAEGLDELRQALDAAPNARAVMDIEARLSAEQALIAAEQMRVQGVLMMQASEARLAAQRDRETIEARRSARIAAFRQGFAN